MIVTIRMVGYIALAALLAAVVVLAAISWVRNRGRKRDDTNDGGAGDFGVITMSADGWGGDSSGDSGSSGD